MSVHINGGSESPDTNGATLAANVMHGLDSATVPSEPRSPRGPLSR